MEVTALRLDDPPSLTGIFPLPFRDDVIVGFNFKKPLEDERKTLRGRLLECEDPDVVIVEPEMPSVAFEMRLAKIIIEKGVVLELSKIALCRREVEDTLQDAECVVLVEHPNGQEVADL